MKRGAQELWSQLVAGGLAVGDMPAAAEARAPWYVRVMLGVSGVIAAIFLLGFAGMAFAFLAQNQTASIAVGLIAVVTAYLLFRVAPRNDFSAMFALSLSIAGQSLVISGIHRATGMPWGMIAALEAALALVMPNVIHRLGSSYAAGIAFAFACDLLGARPFATAVVAAAAAWIWLNEARLARQHSVAAPIGYGLTLALIQIEVTSRYGQLPLWEFSHRAAAGYWPGLGEALMIAVLLGSVFALLRRNAWTLGQARTPLALLLVALIGAASFKAPGIAAGLMIVLLGFSNGNRVLTGLGIAALLFYVASYYYFLDASLLAKSGVLAATGAALLMARWLVLKLPLSNQGRGDA